MPDLVTSFCGAFALLGVKLLYWSSQPVSFGSVLLTACVSGAVAHLLSGHDLAGGVVNGYFGGVVNSTCAGAPLGGPVSLACAMVKSMGE